jgi:hypothetical protein
VVHVVTSSGEEEVADFMVLIEWLSRSSQLLFMLAVMHPDNQFSQHN